MQCGSIVLFQAERVRILRLFTAINFDDTAKDQLCEVIDLLKGSAVKGRYTRRENLHLTLVFLGEVESERAHNIKHAIDRVEEKPFTLQLTGVGRFLRESGEIFWVGAHKCQPLLSIHDQLNNRLIQAGCWVETREYKPHLTLARELQLPTGFDRGELAKQAGAIRIPVQSIDLMKSERIDGVLTYTRIHTKLLHS